VQNSARFRTTSDFDRKSLEWIKQKSALLTTTPATFYEKKLIKTYAAGRSYVQLCPKFRVFFIILPDLFPTQITL